MRIRSLFLCAAAAAVSAPALAAQNAPATSAPAKPQWVLDQSGYYCALATRLAGQPSSTLVLRTLPGTGVYDLSLVGNGWPSKVLTAHQKLGVVLLPAGEAESEEPDTVVTDGGRMLFLPSVSGKFLDGFGKSNGVAVAADGNKVLTYALPGSADAAMNALDQCVVGKLIDAGADPAGFEAGATPPHTVGDPLKWVDIPPIESMGNDSLHVAARLDLGVDGKATGCGVLEVSGRLDRAAVCKNLLERARYTPARDRHGTPVKTVVVYEFNDKFRSWMTLAD
jgi:hypothetical protein